MSADGRTRSAATSPSVGWLTRERARCAIAPPNTASSTGLRSRRRTDPSNVVSISDWRRTRSSPSPEVFGPGSSGLMRVEPPGCSFTTVSPSASASGRYSPLGSTIVACRPNTPTQRWMNVFAVADLPTPGSPAISMFGLVTTPAEYASNGSNANPPPPVNRFEPRYTPPGPSPISAANGYAEQRCAVVVRCRGSGSVGRRVMFIPSSLVTGRSPPATSRPELHRAARSGGATRDLPGPRSAPTPRRTVPTYRCRVR